MSVTHRDPAEERPEGDVAGAEALVIGCGNVLIGDDGFGPALIKLMLERGGVPRGAALIDAGTGVRKLLFDIVLASERPKRIVIVDAVDLGRRAGEVFEISLEEVPAVKSDDFSMHQLPTSNMLKELRDACGVDVRVVAVQVGRIPDEIRPGLSAPVAAALEEARELVLEKLQGGRPCMTTH